MLDEHALLRLHTEQLTRNLAHLLPAPFQESQSNNLVTFNANCQFSQQAQQFSQQDNYTLQTLENNKLNEHISCKNQSIEVEAKIIENMNNQQQQIHFKNNQNNEYHLPVTEYLQPDQQEPSYPSNILNRRQTFTGTQGHYKPETRSNSNSRLRQSLKTFLTPSSNSPNLGMSPNLRKSAKEKAINEDTYNLTTNSFRTNLPGIQNVEPYKMSQNVNQVKEISVKVLALNQQKNTTSIMQSPLTDCYSTALPSPLEQATRNSQNHIKADSEEKQFEVANSSKKLNLNQKNIKSDLQDNQQFKQKHQLSDLASSYYSRLIQFNSNTLNKKSENSLKNQNKLNQSKNHSRQSNSQKNKSEKTKATSDQQISKNGLERLDKNDINDFVLEEAKIFSQDIPEYPKFLRKASLIAEIKKTSSPQVYNSFEINSLLNNSYLATGSFPKMETTISHSNFGQDKIIESNTSDQNNLTKTEIRKECEKRRNKKQAIGGALCIGMDFPLDQMQNCKKQNEDQQGKYDENDQDILQKSPGNKQVTLENSASKQPKTRNSVRQIYIDMSIPASRNTGDIKQSSSQYQTQTQSPEKQNRNASQSKPNNIYKSYLQNPYVFQDNYEDISSNNNLNLNTSLNLSHSPSKIEKVLSNSNRLSFHTPQQLHKPTNQISQKSKQNLLNYQINQMKTKSKSPNNIKNTNQLNNSTKQTLKQVSGEQQSSQTRIQRGATRNRLFSNGRYQSSPDKQEKVAAARRLSQERLHLSKQKIEEQNKQAATSVRTKQQIPSNSELIEQGQLNRKRTPKRDNIQSNGILAITTAVVQTNQQQQQPITQKSSLKTCQISSLKENQMQPSTQDIPNVHGILPTEQMTLNSDTSFTVFRRY